MKKVIFFLMMLILSASFIVPAKLGYLPDNFSVFGAANIIVWLIILSLPTYHIFRKKLSKKDPEEILTDISLAYFIFPAIVFGLFYFIGSVERTFPSQSVYIVTVTTIIWSVLLTAVFHEQIKTIKIWLLIAIYNLASGFGFQTGLYSCQKMASYTLSLFLLGFLLILLSVIYRFIKDNRQYIKA